MSSSSLPSASRRALLGGCTALAVGLAGCSAVDRTHPTPGATVSSADWPHRFRDLGNTNAAPVAPDSLTERWTRRVEARLDRPIVVDGTVFTVAMAHEESAPLHVLAVDAETGEDRWTFELSGVRHARIAAVVDETIYVAGEHVDEADGQRLYAIDAGDSITWTFDADRIAAITAAESVVYASVQHGSIVALDPGDGSRLSQLHPAGWGRRWLSDLVPVGRPAILDGTVFAPFARYDPDREDSYVEERIVAFDAEGISWTRSVADVRFLDDVTAVGETVYVLTTDRRTPVDDPTSSLTALEATSGSHRWTQSIDGGATSAVAAREDLVVVAGRNVTAFDRESGDRRLQREVFSGPPVIAGDRVYGRRTEGAFVDTVVGVDLESGDPVASHTFEYQLNRAPVFADGRAVARTLEYDNRDDGTAHVADRLHALW